MKHVHVILGLFLLLTLVTACMPMEELKAAAAAKQGKTVSVSTAGADEQSAPAAPSAQKPGSAKAMHFGTMTFNNPYQLVDGVIQFDAAIAEDNRLQMHGPDSIYSAMKIHFPIFFDASVEDIRADLTCKSGNTVYFDHLENGGAFVDDGVSTLFFFEEMALECEDSSLCTDHEGWAKIISAEQGGKGMLELLLYADAYRNVPETMCIVTLTSSAGEVTKTFSFVHTGMNVCEGDCESTIHIEGKELTIFTGIEGYKFIDYEFMSERVENGKTLEGYQLLYDKGESEYEFNIASIKNIKDEFYQMLAETETPPYDITLGGKKYTIFYAGGAGQPYYWISGDYLLGGDLSRNDELPKEILRTYLEAYPPTE